MNVFFKHWVWNEAFYYISVAYKFRLVCLSGIPRNNPLVGNPRKTRNQGCFVQIIIPMSGFGERFPRAWYAVPKPLIEIDGKPIIADVIDMFPGEQDFILICNQDHLSNPDYRMESILRQHCPTGRIIGFTQCRKLSS